VGLNLEQKKAVVADLAAAIAGAQTMVLAGNGWSTYPQLEMRGGTRIVAAAPAARQIVRLAARAERSSDRIASL